MEPASWRQREGEEGPGGSPPAVSCRSSDSAAAAACPCPSSCPGKSWAPRAPSPARAGKTRARVLAAAAAAGSAGSRGRRPRSAPG